MPEMGANDLFRTATSLLCLLIGIFQKYLEVVECNVIFEPRSQISSNDIPDSPHLAHEAVFGGSFVAWCCEIQQAQWTSGSWCFLGGEGNKRKASPTTIST